MKFSRLSTMVRQEFDPGRRLFSLRLQIAVLVAGAALLGVGYFLEQSLHRWVHREQLQYMLVAWDPTAWFVWLIAAPVVLALVRKFPLTRGQFPRHLPRILIGSLLIYVGVVNVRFLLRVVPNLWLPDERDLPVDWNTYWASSIVSLPMDFLTFGGFFAAALAIDYYFKHRQRAEETLQLRLRTAQLESELAQAELTALRGQLHPHFLFNSFNAVSTLVRQQRNAAAVETIAQLSALLRSAIERTGKHDLALEDEIEFIHRYLEIERIRFGEKLRLVFEIDPATLPARVPNLLLQPLVENAIKHGISRLTAPGTLRLASRLVEGRLELVIDNDGPDPATTRAPTSERPGGIGLTNTRSRLERAYGANYRFDMVRRSDGGMTVRLNLPFQSESGL